MRVRFENKIFEADKVMHPGGVCNFIYISTPNGYYEVQCIDVQEAKDIMYELLREGYHDFNGREYRSTWMDL